MLIGNHSGQQSGISLSEETRRGCSAKEARGPMDRAHPLKAFTMTGLALVASVVLLLASFQNARADQMTAAQSASGELYEVWATTPIVYEGEFFEGNYALVSQMLSSSYAPANYKDTGVFATKGFAGYSEYYAAIAKKADALVAGVRGDQAKAKAVYSWIIGNISYGDFPDYYGLPDQLGANPYYAWRDHTAICYGYAQLTQLMLQRAGVPCMVVRGDLRRTSGTASGGSVGSNHVWNAVYANGEWRYLDATQGASGQSVGEGEEIVRSSEYFFLMTPERAATWYGASYVECCSGDSCYWPVKVDETTLTGIKLDANGGTCAVSVLAMNKNPEMNGDKCRILPTPVRKNADFLGWFTARTGGKLVSQTNAVTPKAGATLFAHWKVHKKANTLVAKAKVKLFKVKYSKKKPVAIKRAKVVVVKKAKGALAYKNVSRNKTSKKFKVNAKTGNITVPKGAKRGTFTVRVKVTAKGNASYLRKNKIVTFKVKVG